MVLGIENYVMPAGRMVVCPISNKPMMMAAMLALGRHIMGGSPCGKKVVTGLIPWTLGMEQEKWGLPQKE